MIEGAPKVLWLIAICYISFFHIIVIFKVAEPAFCGIATLIRYKIKVVSPLLRIGKMGLTRDLHRDYLEVAAKTE